MMMDAMLNSWNDAIKVSYVDDLLFGICSFLLGVWMAGMMLFAITLFEYHLGRFVLRDWWIYRCYAVKIFTKLKFILNKK